MLLKEKIIKTIEKMNLPTNEYWVTSGAGLVIHGVKECTNDIDLGCTTKLIEEVLKEGYKYKLASDNSRIIQINDSVELLENWFADEIEIINGLPVASLSSIKKQKAELGREKDFRDIKMIDEYLKIHRVKYGRSVRWFKDYKEEVKFSINNGFDFMQLWYVKGDIVVDNIKGDKQEFIKKCDFPVLFHAVLDINEFEEHAPKILDILNYFLHKEVIIHPVCKSEKIHNDTIFKLAENVSKANEIFSKEGITLYIENNSKLDPINYTIRDLEILFSKNPRVELLLDIAHIDSYEHLIDIIKIRQPKMLHIADKHFNAIHEHLPIGIGDLDFKYIFSEVLKDFRGRIIFEIVDEDEEIIKSKNVIRKILEQNF